MASTWSQLLANFAIVAMFVSVWIYMHVWIDRLGATARSVSFGLHMGVGAIAVMAAPIEITPGVLVDLRYTLIAVSGFFGGPVAGVITGLFAGSFRLYEGGAGAIAGCVSIVTTLAVTLAGQRLLRGRPPRRTDIVIIAAAAAIASRAGLGVLPWPVVAAYFKTVALPTTLLDFTSIVLAGLALYQERRRVEALQSKRIYKTVVDALPDCLNIKDLDGRFIAANPATAALMQAPDEKALIGKTDFDFYPREAAQQFREEERAVIRTGEPLTVDQRLERGDGEVIWLSTLKSPLRDHYGRIVGIITHNRDITERKQLQDQLAASRIQLGNALTHMADGLVMYDPSGRIVLCNEQYRAMFPKTAHVRVPGTLQRDVLRASVDSGEIVMPAEQVDAWIDSVVEGHRVGNRQIRLTDGRWIDVRARPTADGGRLSVFSDITVAKQAEADLLAANEKLSRLAHRDGLTDLWTRRAFDETLQREFGRSRRAGSPLSLLLVDVDWFKKYNDLYGHPAGDACLCAVSRCIEAIARRPTDFAARYGGEEFAVILPETDARGALLIAETLTAAIRDKKIPHDGSRRKVVTVSVGVATFDGSSEMDAAQLVRRADEALYGAKAAGRDRVHSWYPQTDEELRRAARAG